MSKLRHFITPHGIEVVSLTEFGLPGPSHRHDSHRVKRQDDVLLSATSKAAAVAAMTDMPTIAQSRGFYIDPMLRWGGGGPQWFWPLPWPYTSEELAGGLKQADNALDASGYCGPDDRGAFFRSVLCLVWPDAESQIFEGRIQGQFGVCGRFNKSAGLVDDYFVPDGETVALTYLTDETHQLYADQEQAFEAFRRALSA